MALALSLAAPLAAADVLVMPEGEPMPELKLPDKGTSMAQVLARYGEPRQRRPTVGGDSPQHPPITRWDYDGFSVIFERDKVVDGVIPGAPPQIVNNAGLERVPVEFVPISAGSPAEPPASTAEPVPQSEPTDSPATASDPATADPQPQPAPATAE